MKFFLAVTLLSLVGAALAAPLSPPIEEDPELTAGYFQGDIVLSDSNRNGYRTTARRWPNKIVYYKFNESEFDTAHRNHTLRGMQMLEDVSCIRFTEATENQTNYILITGKSGGCYSHVGWGSGIRIYNLQIQSLNTGCFRLGSIMHELLHTLGFFHMQSTYNRDEYVRIATENIIPGSGSNFNKYDVNTIDDFGVEYDYGSVMHYSAYSYSANGQMTIVPLKEGVSASVMGQRNGLSQSDINKLNLMYLCPVLT